MSASLVTLLGKCPVDRLNKLLHGVADGITSRLSVTYSTFSEVWTLEEWFEVIDETTTLLKSCVRNSTDKESIFKSLDGLDENLKDSFVTVLKVREGEIQRALKDKSVTVSNKHLQDFDWKVKLVLASDKLANIQEPVAALDLDVKSGDKSESVNLELDKDQLKSLITSLEAANRAVQQYSSLS